MGTIMMGPPPWGMGSPGPFMGPCGPAPCIPIDQGVMWLIGAALILLLYNYITKEE
jgi:hypothetical protein